MGIVARHGMDDPNIHLRPAKAEDSEALFAWRNDPVSRNVSFDSREIPFEDHANWFSSSLENEDRLLVVGEVEGERIGVCRFDMDRDADRAEVSINMNPAMRGRGLGKAFLCQSVAQHLANHGHELFARAKSDNVASRKIFEAAGFAIVGEKDGVLYMRRGL